MKLSIQSRRWLSSEPWRKNLLGHDQAKLIGKRDEKWWYTGLLPQNSPGFDGKYLRSLPQVRLDHVTRESALAYFQNGWSLYENLFASLQGEEAFYRTPGHGLRHPMQFYYGHTAVFYINKAIVAGLWNKPIDKKFESQFEIGVDEMRWDDMTLGDKLWPRVSQVTEYRREVYRIMKEIIEKNFDSSSAKKITWDDPLFSIFMACEHDRIHLETSSVLIRELPLELVRKPEFFPENYKETKDPSKFPLNELIDVKGGPVVMGKAKEYPTFGWDNEYGSITLPVANFRASKDIVTNGEFLEFVKQGGYLQRKYWTEDGWGWRRFRNALHPFFWVRNGPAGSHSYLLRYPFEIGPFSLSLPAIVNYHEAKAFCNWKAEAHQMEGLRITTEAEHQLILDTERRMNSVTPSTDPALLCGGDSIETKFGINTALAYGSERPVDEQKENHMGFRDSTGNVWQWCEDQMTPFPNFEIHPYYVDFTEPCFDGKHQIIKGGSFVSTSDAGSNAHCRYHFRPHFLQHSGFRYVLPSKKEQYAGEAGGVLLLNNKINKNEEENPNKKQTQADYESNRMVAQYLDLHFAEGENENPFNLPKSAFDFPRKSAKFVHDSFSEFMPSSSKLSSARVLDLGCAVGGSTFHLASLGFKEVVGIDFSKAFIKSANEMKETGSISFDNEENIKVTVSLKKGLEIENRMKTTFLQGDACNLNNEIGTFDAILGANLLCRLPDPHALLNRLPTLVNENGIVVFLSPYSWMTSFTDKRSWIGSVGGSEKELIAEMKSLGFKLVKEDNMHLMIKEHRRKYQYIISHATVFKRV